MFINMQNKTQDEIQIYKNELIKEHSLKEITDFWNLDELWKKIWFHINKKDYNAFADFNGKIIIVSEDITEDSLYNFILGKTKQEYLDESNKNIQKIRLQRKQYEDSINSLIPQYRQNGRKVIKEKYWEEWDNLVTPFLESIYQNFLLDSALDILTKYHKHKMTNQEIERALEHHGHSGASYAITVDCLSRVSDFGKEYKKWLNDKYRLR